MFLQPLEAILWTGAGVLGAVLLWDRLVPAWQRRQERRREARSVWHECTPGCRYHQATSD